MNIAYFVILCIAVVAVIFCCGWCASKKLWRVAALCVPLLVGFASLLVSVTIDVCIAWFNVDLPFELHRAAPVAPFVIVAIVAYGVDLIMLAFFFGRNYESRRGVAVPAACQ